MSVQSHIESLQRQHGELEQQLDVLNQQPSVPDADRSDIKRRKLKIKDRISCLERSGES